jgi:hypothetical protein
LLPAVVSGRPGVEGSLAPDVGRADGWTRMTEEGPSNWKGESSTHCSPGLSKS